MNLTNYLLTICVQKESDADAIAFAHKAAKHLDEWVQVDFRDGGRFAKVGPKGEMLLSNQRPTLMSTGSPTVTPGS